MSNPRSSGRRPLAPFTSWALILLCACVASGCLTPRVVALAKGTQKERYAATIASVTRAARSGSGALLVCVETLTSLDAREQVHVLVPLQKLASLQDRRSLEFARDAGFDSAAATDTSALRYVFFARQLMPGCPEVEPSLPIHASAADGARDPGIYTTPGEKGLSLRYHSSDALWSTLRDVDLAPVLEGEVDRPGTGNPGYWLVLPFALLADALIALPLFISL